ncbi:MAG: murein L,D-transpeptidase family protein [Methylocella sp.]
MSSNSDRFFRIGAFALIAAAAAFLGGCEETGFGSIGAHANDPIAPETVALMKKMDTSENAPVLIRTYKKESELEIWKMKADGRYALLKTYPVCRWSGQLGPKTREGDRQVPEGFYSITPAQMKPNSAYYLAFNVGYPNAYDRALGHDGGAIMVHGICSSAGCFSMTDPQIGEIYAVVREAFTGAQREVQMQSYPFRMTAENLAKYRLDPNIGFWKQLKEGSDNFEVTNQEVVVGVCNKHYVFNAAPANGAHFDSDGPCPQLKRDEEVSGLVAAKQSRDDAKVAELAAQGLHPIQTVYADGGQNPYFASIAAYASRPDALSRGPVDVALDDSAITQGAVRKGRMSPVVQVAAAKINRAKVAASAPTTAAANPKVADSSDVTASITKPAKEADKPWMFANFFGAKAAEAAPADGAVSATPAAPVAH